MMYVRISAYDLVVEIQADLNYPDALSDIMNRANETFKQSVDTMKTAGVAIAGADLLLDEDFDL
jgi:hypothetical protein